MAVGVSNRTGKHESTAFDIISFSPRLTCIGKTGNNVVSLFE
jgi:hypothetical protein